MEESNLGREATFAGEHGGNVQQPFVGVFGKNAPDIRVRFDFSPSDIAYKTDEIIAISEKTHDAVAAVPLSEVSYERVIAPLAMLEAEQFALAQSCEFPSMVSTSKAIRDASTEAEKKLDAHNVKCRWSVLNGQALEKEGGAGAGVLGFLGSSDFGNEDGKLALKQAQVIERQTAKNQLRQQEIAKAREEAAQSFNPGESPAAFLDKFSAERCRLEVGLHALSARRGEGEVEPDLASLQQQVAEMTYSLTHLKESLAVSSYFLPRFDLRNCQAAVSKLEEYLATARNQIAPKKKFTFASKKKKGPARTTVDGSQPQSSPSAAAEAESSPRVTSSATANRADNEAKLSKGLTGVKGAVIVKGSDDLVSGEFTLADLVNCDVYLHGTLSALFIHNLWNCKVYSGPVMGAVHVDGASGCVFMLASHQIRIHSTKQSDFYLRVRSGPIIEHSAAVGFAPYAFWYMGIEADLRNAGLTDEMGLWEKVEDFGWLRAAKSPNWYLIPVSKRLPPVDGSEVVPSQSRR